MELEHVCKQVYVLLKVRNSQKDSMFTCGIVLKTVKLYEE